MKIREMTLPSKRHTDIPVTVVDCEKETCGLLVFVHGFKANRTEDGRFLTVAKAMAEDGFSSVMQGFPGCDASTEDFINYTLKNCLDDIDTSVAWMRENFRLDHRCGMVGYSMGGRLTALYLRQNPEVQCAGFWAGACYEAFDGEETFLGQNIEQMKQEASEKGYCNFFNAFDNTMLRLSSGLLQDMEEMNPVEGLEAFTGDAVVVHGTADVTVLPKVGRKTYDHLVHARKKELVLVAEADHGFGAWEGRPELSAQLTDNTIRFFRENLK